MYAIRDIVKLDEHVLSRSVVQIDFFSEHDENLRLLNSFVFAPTAPSGKYSTLELLRKLREVSITDVLSSSFCFIATYGHGKSHFALVLANYFGKPVDSEEFRVLMDKIAHAETDEVRVRNLREFREHRAPYLVVRLRGDRALPLDQQFLQEVQAALREQGLEERLPLWFHAAGKWLAERGQDGVFADGANAFLEERFGIDLPMLLHRVGQFDRDTYDIVNQLHRHLYGTTPYFAADIGVGEALGWLVENLCGEAKPFGGVLVLFDEFSLAVQNYVRSHTRTGTLQSLLEAVDAHRPYTLFVAFSQHDPMSVANAESMGRAQADNLLKELQRIPNGNKLLLYSRMEQVIDGYLRQDEDLWEIIRRDNREFDDALSDASRLARSAFSKQYQADQGWDVDEFERTVTMGCFPMHPLTTAVLCNVSLAGEVAQTETPRTVLGFVHEYVDRQLDLPAFENGRPNWVYPIALVDYFESMLPEREFAQYREAMRRIEGQPTHEQVAVLKAMLLVAIADMHTSRSDIAHLISHLSGCNLQTVKQTLKTLAESHALYEDNGRYRLPSSGGDITALKRLRRDVMEGPLEQADIDRLNKDARIVAQQGVDVPWGHPDDWGASEVVLLQTDFTPQRLRQRAPLSRVQNNGVSRPVPGLVVRLLAITDEDVDRFREGAQRVLDEAFPEEYPPAVLVVLPVEPMPDLPKLLRWREHLEKGLTPSEIEQIGRELVDAERSDVEAKIDEAVKQFRVGDAASDQPMDARLFVVPAVYRSQFQRRAPQTVREALKTLYTSAYPFAPPFFQQYGHTATNLRKDVRQLCIKLAENRVREIASTLGNGPGKDCVHKFLCDEWGILDTSYQIVSPGANRPTAQAWQLLDGWFSPTEEPRPVGDVLLELMNPPYGYNFHQLALLFSAWYGYNRGDLQLSVGGRLASLPELWDEKGVDRSEQFIGQLAYVKRVAIKRRDRAKEEEEAEQMAREVTSGTRQFTQEEAQTALSRLGEYVKDEERPEARRKEVQHAWGVLSKDLQRAREYDQRADRLCKIASATSGLSLGELVNAYVKPDLPDLGVVQPLQPSQQDVKERLLGRIQQVVEHNCQEAERLSRLEDVSRYDAALQSVLKQVERTQVQELIQRVSQAIEVVNGKADELRREAEDRELAGELRAMDPNAVLATLRRYLNRLQDMQPRAESTRARRDAKLAEIEGAICKSEERVKRWQDELSDARDPRDLQRLSDEITRRLSHYEGAEEHATVNALLNECQRVHRLLAEARGVREPQHPSELCEALGYLDQLASQTDHPAVREAVESARHRIESAVGRKQDEAVRWLARNEEEARFAHGQRLSQLQEDLQSPPPFLPPDRMDCLHALRQDVEKRLEADAVESVRRWLSRIHDRGKLQQIREEIDRRLEGRGE